MGVRRTSAAGDEAGPNDVRGAGAGLEPVRLANPWGGWSGKGRSRRSASLGVPPTMAGTSPTTPDAVGVTMSAARQSVSTDRVSVVVIGDGAKARQCAHALINLGRGRFRLAGVIKPADTERYFFPTPTDHAEAGRELHEVGGVAMKRLPGRVVVALDDRRGSLPVDRLVDLRFRGVEVQDVATFLEEMTGKVPVLSIHPADLAYGPGFRLSRAKKVTKAGGEYLLAIAMCALALPLLAAAAVGILIETGSPIFYTQDRVGLRGRIFRVIKLRTMVKDAEKMQAQLRPLNEVDGPVFKMENDPRSTRLGRLLRRFSIDEIPQLWNVVKGEMSLVGPRPLAAREMKFCSAWRDARLKVRPGVTGLWQVSGRSKTSFHDWIRLDIEYVRERSTLLDLKILLKTFLVVLRGLGSF